MTRSRLLAPLREAPAASAIVLDVDGTLAPIAPRPELASVPTATREVLARLVERYRLVACLTGRAGLDAATLVGVPGIRMVGNHGLELDPRAAEHATRVAAFRAEVGARWPCEDKHLSLSFHYRDADDEPAALVVLQQVAELARTRGLEARWGRKVLDVRPAEGIDKGAATALLVQTAGARRALFAGDDATDLDAMRALTILRLDHSVSVGVLSPETPRALYATADILVDGTGGVCELLQELAEP